MFKISIWSIMLEDSDFIVWTGTWQKKKEHKKVIFFLTLKYYMHIILFCIQYDDSILVFSHLPTGKMRNYFWNNFSQVIQKFCNVLFQKQFKPWNIPARVVSIGIVGTLRVWFESYADESATLGNLCFTSLDWTIRPQKQTKKKHLLRKRWKSNKLQYRN